LRCFREIIGFLGAVTMSWSSASSLQHLGCCYLCFAKVKHWFGTNSRKKYCQLWSRATNISHWSAHIQLASSSCRL